MVTTPRAKTVRKFLSLSFAGIGAFMTVVDIALGCLKEDAEQLYLPSGLGLFVIGAALYLLRRKKIGDSHCLPTEIEATRPTAPANAHERGLTELR